MRFGHFLNLRFMKTILVFSSHLSNLQYYISDDNFRVVSSGYVNEQINEIKLKAFPSAGVLTQDALLITRTRAEP